MGSNCGVPWDVLCLPLFSPSPCPENLAPRGQEWPGHTVEGTVWGGIPGGLGMGNSGTTAWPLFCSETPHVSSHRKFNLAFSRPVLKKRGKKTCKVSHCVVF